MQRSVTFWLLCAFCALWSVANIVNWQFAPLLGKPRMYILGLAPLIVVLVVTFVVRRHGWRGAVFRITPTVIVLLAVEALFRIFYNVWATPEQKAEFATEMADDLGAGPIYSGHHYSIYTPSPNLKRADGLAHNSLGFRDSREFPPDANAYRIVFLGGSTTYTIGLRDNSTIFSTGLESKLNDHYRDQLAGRRIQVINAGMGAATSAENLVRLIFFVSEIEPDLIIIQHGLNDVAPRAIGGLTSDYSNYRKSWDPPTVFHPRFSIAYNLSLATCRVSMACNFVVMRSRLAKTWHLYHYTARAFPSDESPVNLPTNGPEYFIRNTRYMIAVARAMDAEVVLASIAFTDSTTPTRRIGTEQHNRLLPDIASESGVRFYDFASEMIHDADHFPDGVHVSQRGSDLKRDRYLDYLIREKVIDSWLHQGGQ